MLGALALALVGYQALNRTLGENQGWNHAGNIVAALLAFVAVKHFGSASIFYSVAIASLVGAFSVYWIRAQELDENVASGNGNQAEAKWSILLHDRPVLFLLAAVAVFHLANAPILPVTALYIKRLGGSSALTTFTVLSAQMVMVPVAWASGKLCDSWGRKPVMAMAPPTHGSTIAHGASSTCRMIGPLSNHLIRKEALVTVLKPSAAIFLMQA